MTDVADEKATHVDEQDAEKTDAAKNPRDKAAKDAPVDHGVGLLHR